MLGLPNTVVSGALYGLVCTSSEHSTHLIVFIHRFSGRLWLGRKQRRLLKTTYTTMPGSIYHLHTFRESCIVLVVPNNRVNNSASLAEVVYFEPEGAGTVVFSAHDNASVLLTISC